MASERQNKVGDEFHTNLAFDNRLDHQSFSFESYVPISEGDQPWPNIRTDWDSWVDFNLCEDWSTFLCSNEFT
jgi:hypothetical protein